MSEQWPDTDKNDSDIINELEPHEYFKELKSKLNKIESEALETQLQQVAKELISARELGLKAASHKLAFLYQIIIKEQTLFAKGYSTFVYMEDVAKWIDSITPKNSIRICELDRYPRLIPVDNAKKIKELSDLNLFDLILIIYTDYTDQDISTPAEKEFVKRNRDPIAVGMFHSEIMNFKHDRLYYITDWEDEYCDLTFVKMLERMAKSGIKNPKKEISYDFNYVNQLVAEALGEAKDVAEKPIALSSNSFTTSYSKIPTKTKDTLLKKVAKLFTSFGKKDE